MSHYNNGAIGPAAYRAELRDTVVKSSLSGVAFTVFVVAMCSPAGLGGLIGTSVASFGFDSLDPNNTGRDVVSFPATPPPISSEELIDMRQRLDISAAAIDNMRAVTDAEIDFIRTIAVGDNVLALNAPVAEPVAPSVLTAERDSHLEFAELLIANSDSARP